jgi:hypothetical protein
MSFTKPVLKGLKLSECKQGVMGKNSPIHYILEKDPVQEALEKKKDHLLQIDASSQGHQAESHAWA